MKLKDWLLPREERFYEMFDQQAVLVVQGAERFLTMLKAGWPLGSARQEIHDIEHAADRQTHAIFDALNASFITPIDGEDIAAVAQALDDVVDYIWATTNRIHLYELGSFPDPLVRLGEVLVEQAMVVRDALTELRHLSGNTTLQTKLAEVSRLEKKADEINNQALLELFQLDDVKTIIKLKDIYSDLETATDKCLDVADVIRSILVKHQ
jgi:predicted phosphate transport protein (TIGR00153 family)